MTIATEPTSFFRTRVRWTGPDAKELVCSSCGDDYKLPAGFDEETNHGKRLLFLLELGRRRFHRKREGLCMAEVRDYAQKLQKLPDRIAAIVGKTVAVMGDDFQVADDEALMRINDLLTELDPTLIERNKNKRLTRR